MLCRPRWSCSYRRLPACLAVGATLAAPANRTGLGDDPTFRPGSWPRKQATVRTAGRPIGRQSVRLELVPWPPLRRPARNVAC
ncbi:hypothetical protein OG500_37485 [Kitasatospora sp. NBC_01250]|uniref:hypothetical protein n=1 Tax=Kitasatospora sp. NBC_01250 TaxID=2903571 RepID=UPI002E306F51|nr:hypothetical protein [Kitasatospora sp. NBC_01250]